MSLKSLLMPKTNDEVLQFSMSSQYTKLVRKQSLCTNMKMFRDSTMKIKKSRPWNIYWKLKIVIFRDCSHIQLGVMTNMFFRRNRKRLNRMGKYFSWQPIQDYDITEFKACLGLGRANIIQKSMLQKPHILGTKTGFFFHLSMSQLAML